VAYPGRPKNIPPAPLPTVDPVELMMAAVGIKAIISRKVETISNKQLRDMDDLPERINEAVRVCVDGTSIEYEPEPYDYRQTLQDLALGWDVGQVQAMIEQFPDDFMSAGSALIVRSQEIIKAMLRDYPVTNYQTVAGSDQLTPSNTKMFRFVSVLEVVDHPECIPYLIHCGGLLQSQVKAMRAVYPTLSEFIDAALFQAITAARAKDKSFQLPFRVEYGVKAWWGRPPISDQSLAKAQMVAKAATAKKNAQAQAEAEPPSRQSAADSPDSTALGRAEAASG
jgi:hypothetical protein